MTLAETLTAYFEPGVHNSSVPTPGVDLVCHPRLEVLQHGVSWHKAGLATTPDQHEAIAAAEHLIYPDGLRMTEIRTWQTQDPNSAFIEWRNAGTRWDGRNTANGGLTLFQLEDQMVRRVRSFTNTAYLQAIEAGWEKLVPYDTLLHVPAYHTLGLPMELSKPYPPAPGAKKETDPPFEFEEPYTNEQKIALTYDPPVFDLHEPRRYLSYNPDMYFEWQGTKWWMAGRNYRRDQLAAVERGSVSKFVVHTWLRFTHINTWSTEDQRWVFLEWYSKSDMWNGKDFRNHGMTALNFDDEDRLLAHREYSNSGYNEALEGDWKDQMEPEAFAAKACSKTWDLPSDEWKPLPIYDTEPAR